MIKNFLQKINIFWFRRDLRFEDNTGLNNALKHNFPVLLLFIFDTDILDELEEKDDPRVDFIHQQVSHLHNLAKGSFLVKIGQPLQVFKNLIESYNISDVYTNHDYEPYAIKRDAQVKKLLYEFGISFYSFKDQVIFEKDEIVSPSGTPYKVFTPYKKRWLGKYISVHAGDFKVVNKEGEPTFYEGKFPMPYLEELGFLPSPINFPSSIVNEDIILNYAASRDFPHKAGTSRLGIHLRFGTISIRTLARLAYKLDEVFLGELIWREFYMMILYHHPHVVHKSFKSRYENVKWLNREEDFEDWCTGRTGYPIVDAGMRELNATGFMHNRVRMIVASFLTKHLLIDWRWGEAYFAGKLLDYELASNNGGWQWAAGTGTDAQPYFRVFNPALQQEKWDKSGAYIKKWIPEIDTPAYPQPIVEHSFARTRAIETYKKALKP